MEDRKTPLAGFQKKYLRGLAHGLKPVVLVGQGGVTAQVIRELDETLDRQELVKIRFLSEKGREEKDVLLRRIEEEAGVEAAGVIGHTAILYRRHRDPEKRKIRLPEREEKGS
ncbi:MAG TPA: YhbY family RNA-binding protein [Syntrophales bacterium]|nr:YhbY family RNA-binding protein [Syntrophales bacterium]